MSLVEKQLNLVDTRHDNRERVITDSKRDQLLILIDQLAENQGQYLVAETLEEMRCLLGDSQTELSSTLTTIEDRGFGSKPAPVFEISEAP